MVAARRISSDSGYNLLYYLGHRARVVEAFGPDVVKFRDDFVDSVVAADAVTGYTVTLVEAGAGESTITHPDTVSGVLLFTTDANEDDGINFQLTGEAFKLDTQAMTWFGARFKASEATQIDWLIGLCITDTDLLGGMTDGVYFRKADGAATMAFVTEKDSTETSTAAGTFAADTYTEVAFGYDGTSVFGFVNGTLVATHTTNIPDDELLTPSLQVLAGSAAARTLTLDVWHAGMIGRG